MERDYLSDLLSHGLRLLSEAAWSIQKDAVRGCILGIALFSFRFLQQRVVHTPVKRDAGGPPPRPARGPRLLAAVLLVLGGVWMLASPLPPPPSGPAACKQREEEEEF